MCINYSLSFTVLIPILGPEKLTFLRPKVGVLISLESPFEQ